MNTEYSHDELVNAFEDALLKKDANEAKRLFDELWQEGKEQKRIERVTAILQTYIDTVQNLDAAYIAELERMKELSKAIHKRETELTDEERKEKAKADLES